MSSITTSTARIERSRKTHRSQGLGPRPSATHHSTFTGAIASAGSSTSTNSRHESGVFGTYRRRRHVLKPRATTGSYGITAQRARSATYRFAGLFRHFPASSGVPENRGVPSSSLGLAISRDACTWRGFQASRRATWGALKARRFASRPFTSFSLRWWRVCGAVRPADGPLPLRAEKPSRGYGSSTSTWCLRLMRHPPALRAGSDTRCRTHTPGAVGAP
jgi:hypothetical protein